MTNAPIPANEMERVLTLAEFDVDYSAHKEGFKDLVKLAAKVAGTQISLVNLIDTFTTWTISDHGLPIEQVPRDESVCQYTIMGDGPFEVPDMAADERFRQHAESELKLKYYYGVPLKTNEGINLGALCVVDRETHHISPEKAELLKIIADEIVNRLKAFKTMDNLKAELNEANESKRKVAHDIRGPLGGIIGLAQVIAEQGHENQIDEVLEFINMIHKSGRSILELADEILSIEAPQVKAGEFNLLMFKDKLEKLYQPQAVSKSIEFIINLSPDSAKVPFSKNKLLQITGNLISNAMKFTPVNGTITVDLNLEITDTQNVLDIKVSDTGVGLTQDGIDKILNGSATSTNGTGGEQGYGFGLALVKHLIEGLNGKFEIESTPGNGACFHVRLPQAIKA